MRRAPARGSPGSGARGGRSGRRARARHRRWRSASRRSATRCAAEDDGDEARRARANAQLRQRLLEFVRHDLALGTAARHGCGAPGLGRLRRRAEALGDRDGHRERRRARSRGPAERPSPLRSRGRRRGRGASSGLECGVHRFSVGWSVGWSIGLSVGSRWIGQGLCAASAAPEGVLRRYASVPRVRLDPAIARACIGAPAAVRVTRITTHPRARASSSRWTSPRVAAARKKCAGDRHRARERARSRDRAPRPRRAPPWSTARDPLRLPRRPRAPEASLRSEALERALRSGRARRLGRRRRASSSTGRDPAGSTRRVAVVGSGPAGLYAAWCLAANGVAVDLIERGPALRERSRAVARFTRSREPSIPRRTCSSARAAPGPTPTASSTRGPSTSSKRRSSRPSSQAGAPAEIRFDARAHVGTDRLHRILPRLREPPRGDGRVASISGRGSRASCCTLDARRGASSALRTTAGELPCDAVVLALGHSARDTIAALAAEGLPRRGQALPDRPAHRASAGPRRRRALRRGPRSRPPRPRLLCPRREGRGRDARGPQLLHVSRRPDRGRRRPARSALHQRHEQLAPLLALRQLGPRRDPRAAGVRRRHLRRLALPGEARGRLLRGGRRATIVCRRSVSRISSRVARARSLPRSSCKLGEIGGAPRSRCSPSR